MGHHDTRPLVVALVVLAGLLMLAVAYLPSEYGFAAFFCGVPWVACVLGGHAIAPRGSPLLGGVLGAMLGPVGIVLAMYVGTDAGRGSAR